MLSGSLVLVSLAGLLVCRFCYFGCAPAQWAFTVLLREASLGLVHA